MRRLFCMKSIDLMALYTRLFDHFGPQHWWPTIETRTSKFEICVGAILTQNTAWTNVEKALQNLHDRERIAPEKIMAAPIARLCQTIRPAGYFNQKAKKLKLFSRFVVQSGGLRSVFRKPIPELRETLLGIWGIGRETADSIILYAAEKPIFVVDVYTKRLLAELGVVFRDYDEYREFFETRLPRRVRLWNEYHALIVAWGKLAARDPAAAQKLLSRLCS